MSGHVEKGESIYDAAIRETTEEIGVSVRHEDLELIMLSQMGVDRSYLNYTFLCKNWDGKPKIMEPEKNSELAWFLLDNLPNNLTPTIALLRERKMLGDTTKVEYVDSSRLTHLLDQRGNA